MASRSLTQALVLMWLLSCSAAAGESPRNSRPVGIGALEPGTSITDWRARFESVQTQISSDVVEPQVKPLLPWQREQPFYWDGAMPRRIFQPPSIIPPSGLWIEPRPPVIRSRRSGSQSP